jgi:cytochrome c oxidase assembly factor 5
MPLSETLPTHCKQLKKGYGDCKRGMVDMRKRFRGNRPAASSVELEGSGGSGQMYASVGEKTNPVKIEAPPESEGSR